MGYLEAGGMEIIENGALAPETAAMREREERIQRALSVINNVTESIADEDMALVPVHSLDDILEDPDIYVLGAYNIEGDQIVDLRFDFERNLLSGAADSGHSVLGGALCVDKADGTQREIQVAAKVHAKRDFKTRMQRAKTEVFFMQDLERRGELTTRPVAIVVTPDDETFNQEVIVISERAQLLTLDNHPWGRGLTESNITKALQAVKALARFHTFGMKHGDASIKNFAEEEHGRKDIGMIDYETSSQIDIYNTAQVSDAVYDDVGKLLGSLAKKRFISDNADSRRIVDDLGEEYMERWNGFPQNIQEAVALAVLGAIEGAKLDLKPKSYARELVAIG